MPEQLPALASQSRLLELIFADSHNGIILCDTSYTILTANSAFCKMTGYLAQELIGETPEIIRSDRHNKQFYQTIFQRLTLNNTWTGTIWDKKKNGDIFLVEVTITRLVDDLDTLTGYIGIFTDNSEGESSVSIKANYDPLTSLPNRILFREHLNFMVAHARRNNQILSLLLLNLNRFKVINDTLGHVGGDMVLVNTAGRIRKTIREIDGLFRLGNDEFAIVLEEVSKLEDPAKVAKKILAEFQEPFSISCFEEKFYVSASIGISIFPQDGSDIDSIIKNAETAMYQAKELEQNSFQHYSPAMNSRTFEHLTMEHQLHKALDQNQFLVYFQPFIDVRENRLVGAEALVRWNHPDIGIIPPVKFIPMAEETGLIVPIGEFVLRESCRKAQEWRSSGHPDFFVAVNLSARQFHQYDLKKKVEEILAETGLPPDGLELEITESLGMKDAQLTIKTLSSLRDMGIRIAIDDFGTGYSSLAYLKKFPLNTLKIDQSFVRDITENRDSEAIVNLIINMAHTLKLTVIAEGVETDQHLNCLQKYQCDIFQGYLFSKPVPAAEFIKLFALYTGNRANDSTLVQWMLSEK